ncbi:hypothetical protein [Dactylosporangium sp. CA-139066]|uniref:hypothetical protein n=1 Tax=Dactylosporangium sp. CA-139066 TaxID=3239930 RepID=UPI003D9441E7
MPGRRFRFRFIMVYAWMVDIDVTKTAAAVMPYVAAAVASYGASTLDKVRDEAAERAADATVTLGHRLLHMLLRRGQSRPALEGAVVDVAAGEPEGPDALRLQIRKALTADPVLAGEIAALLPAPSIRIEASGNRSIAIGTNYGIASTGNDSTFFHR